MGSKGSFSNLLLLTYFLSYNMPGLIDRLQFAISMGMMEGFYRIKLRLSRNARHFASSLEDSGGKKLIIFQKAKMLFLSHLFKITEKSN